MLVMVVFFIEFRCIHLSNQLIGLFLLVLILILIVSLNLLPVFLFFILFVLILFFIPFLNFLPVCFALSLLRFRLPSRLPIIFILWMVAMMVVIIPSRTV